MENPNFHNQPGSVPWSQIKYQCCSGETVIVTPSNLPVVEIPGLINGGSPVGGNTTHKYRVLECIRCGSYSSSAGNYEGIRVDFSGPGFNIGGGSLDLPGSSQSNISTWNYQNDFGAVFGMPNCCEDADWVDPSQPPANSTWQQIPGSNFVEIFSNSLGNYNNVNNNPVGQFSAFLLKQSDKAPVTDCTDCPDYGCEGCKNLRLWINDGTKPGPLFNTILQIRYACCKNGATFKTLTTICYSS